MQRRLYKSVMGALTGGILIAGLWAAMPARAFGPPLRRPPYCTPYGCSAGHYITCWRRLPPMYACCCPIVYEHVHEAPYSPPAEEVTYPEPQPVEGPLPAPAVVPAPQAPQPSGDARPPVIVEPKTPQEVGDPEPQSSNRNLRDSMRGVTSAFQAGRPNPRMAARPLPAVIDRPATGATAPRPNGWTSARSDAQPIRLPKVDVKTSPAQTPAHTTAHLTAPTIPRAARIAWPQRTGMLRLPPVGSVPLSQQPVISEGVQCSYPRPFGD